MKDTCQHCGADMPRNCTVHAQYVNQALVICCSRDCVRAATRAERARQAQVQMQLLADGRPLDPRPRGVLARLLACLRLKWARP